MKLTAPFSPGVQSKNKSKITILNSLFKVPVVLLVTLIKSTVICCFQQKAATRGSATASFGDISSLNKPKE